MHHEEPVSATHQMYLKALYRLAETRPIGRVRDVAEALGLTPGTVSATLNRLQDQGLVERERYGGAVLTASGAAIARCVMRRYDTVHALLTELCGVDGVVAEADACRMEHSVSPGTVNRMEKLVEALRSGESIDRARLAALHESADDACAECAAAGVCGAARAAARDRQGVS